ncbi:hypothetical protein V6N13_071791 [Hibiscus sabdariffa]|uniref:Uncharacterized protein n=1 Tax=Hibiscus sabdariffa TaxID=183260 RepID=A0ABR2TCE5_9ROSI
MTTTISTHVSAHIESDQGADAVPVQHVVAVESEQGEDPEPGQGADVGPDQDPNQACDSLPICQHVPPPTTSPLATPAMSSETTTVADFLSLALQSHVASSLPLHVPHSSRDVAGPACAQLVVNKT